MSQQDEIQLLEDQMAGTLTESDPDDAEVFQIQGSYWADLAAVLAMLGGLALIWWSPYWIATPTPNRTLTFLIYWPFSLIWIWIWRLYGRIRRRRATVLFVPGLMMSIIYIFALLYVSLQFMLFGSVTCTKTDLPNKHIKYSCTETMFTAGSDQYHGSNTSTIKWLDMTFEGGDGSIVLRKTNYCILCADESSY